jgi:superfamily II DNA or RNA helicase
MDYLDIIDNRRNSLKDEVNHILSTTEEAKFAVGYLFLSGFNEIIRNISHLKELKLIIGIASDTKTIEEISEGIARREELENAAKRLSYQKPEEREKIINGSKYKIGQSIGGLEQSEENENMILSLRDLIATGKVKVRLYTKHRLHSKAYIFKYKRETAEQTRSEGIAIVGSSNLTLAGFTQSTELNVYVRGNENFKEINRWFEDLWNESEDFSKELLETIDNSWALKYANPYDVYILTLYNLVRSKRQFRSGVLWNWSGMPQLYRFQKIAVMQAYEILNRYDGVFISDVVGLGKTFVGSALLKQLNKRAVVICPPRLKDMWEEFGEKFKIDIKTISLAALNRGIFDEESILWKYRDRDVVLIDESHYFRNSDTLRYREVQPFLVGKKVILLTATPQNTSIWNIYNQIRLFNQEGSNNYQVKGGSLKEFFNLVERKEAKIQDLLSKVLIRRTRKHIQKYYQSLDNIPIEFPKRELKTISYNIDETYNNLFEKIESALKKLTYAKYNLWSYVKEEKQNEAIYMDLKKVTGTLKGLHKVMLYKRLESSINAFAKTIERLLAIHKKFYESLEAGIIPAGEEAQDLIYNEDIEIPDVLEELKEVSKKYNVSDFKMDKLKQDLKKDIEILTDIEKFLENVSKSSDKKLEELEKILVNHKKEKILIFSEYADTVKYIYERLKGKVENLSFVTSETKDAISIIRRFAPKANGYKSKDNESPIDVLVSTDVLSAGLNLQDCGIIVNYDLHWNPVLLVQRAGRIDRIGTEHETIRIYNFLPHKRIEERISLKERLSRRIQEIHDHIGEDEKILDESERLNEEALYAIYESMDIEKLEEEIDEDEFNLDEAELLIETLEREKPEYMNYIRTLQQGTRSCKKGENYQGVFAYFRKGDIDGLYILDKKGEIVQDIGKVISEIRCSAEEKQLNISKEDKQLLFTSLKQLEEYFKKDYQSRVESESQKPNVVVKVIKKLADLRKKMKNEEDLTSIDIISNALSRGIPDEALKDLRKLEKTSLDDNEYLSSLVKIYNKYKLGNLQPYERKEQEYEAIELICSEVLK